MISMLFVLSALSVGRPRISSIDKFKYNLTRAKVTSSRDYQLYHSPNFVSKLPLGPPSSEDRKTTTAANVLAKHGQETTHKVRVPPLVVHYSIARDTKTSLVLFFGFLFSTAARTDIAIDVYLRNLRASEAFE